MQNELTKGKSKCHLKNRTQWKSLRIIKRKLKLKPDFPDFLLKYFTAAHK